MKSEILNGTVKFFNSEKGYGFIINEDTGSDVFFHVSKVSGRVEKNDHVSYQEAEGKKGTIQAINVSLI